MAEIIVGAIIGLVGTAFGGWLDAFLRRRSARATAKAELRDRATACQIRLEKIRAARSSGSNQPGSEMKRENVLTDEFQHLGSDLDAYLSAAATFGESLADHLDVYRKSLPILISHDTEAIDQAIEAFQTKLEDIRGAR